MLRTWIDDHSLQKTQSKTKTIQDYLGGSSVQK
jgi:hypothetical protein